MKAYVFPGQGSQFPGMAKDLYEQNSDAAEILNKADEILGFSISKTMFEGSEEELKQTRVTQPSIFIHSIAAVKAMGSDFKPDMAAGHSLGEFSALTACNALEFEDALKLVYQRAMAMQEACEKTPSTMAAIMGLEDDVIEKTCREIEETVVPANYNSPGQVVISGSREGINQACEKLKEAGAKRAVELNVGGAFHSPLMEPARANLAEAIDQTNFSKPSAPVYQNADAQPQEDPEAIKENLKKQLTSPVKWTQTVQKMRDDGATSFIETGPGKVLQTLIKKVDRSLEVSGTG